MTMADVDPLAALWTPQDAWKTEAICRRLTTPEKACFHSTEPLEQDFAKAICCRCPVQPQCLDHGRSHHESGIWGGQTEHERNTNRKEKSNGRR